MAADRWRKRDNVAKAEKDPDRDRLKSVKRLFAYQSDVHLIGPLSFWLLLVARTGEYSRPCAFSTAGGGARSRRGRAEESGDPES